MLTSDKLTTGKKTIHSADAGHPPERLADWYHRTKAWLRPNAYYNDDLELERSGVVENKLVERSKE